MANQDRPKGLSPQGAGGRLTPYTAGVIVYPGDAVRMQADGKVDIATAAQSLIGVAANYAAADAEVMVYDDPDQKFTIQADSATTLSQTSIGLNYDIVVGTVDAVFRQSRTELDGSTASTSSILPLRLLGVSREVGSSIGLHMNCVVRINNHQLGKVVEGE